jgi:uncharacterized cupin superfamily protein
MPETAIPPFQTRPLAMHLVAGFCLGEYDYRTISDAYGLTQFGVQIEVSPSQKKLSLHHWHQANDEVVYMLSGEVFLLEKDEKVWCKGDATCWPAAVLTVHHVESRRGADASYQTVRTGNKQDAMYYSSSLDNL